MHFFKGIETGATNILSKGGYLFCTGTLWIRQKENWGWHHQDAVAFG